MGVGIAIGLLAWAVIVALAATTLSERQELDYRRIVLVAVFLTIASGAVGYLVERIVS